MPCIAAALLQLWPSVVSAWRQKRIVQSAGAAHNPSNSACDFSDSAMLEHQTQQIQPSPTYTRGRKRKVARPGNLSLPNTISNPATSLVESSVRRSSRLNKADGFCAVRLEREPARKKNISIIQIDEQTGRTGPVPLAVLQSWGINCGLAPGELTNEGLMLEPSNDQVDPTENDDDDLQM